MTILFRKKHPTPYSTGDTRDTKNTPRLFVSPFCVTPDFPVLLIKILASPFYGDTRDTFLAFLNSKSDKSEK